MEESDPPRKPRDARTVEAILKSMGVESYDPRVVNQLLELLYRYVSSILTDSREFSEHAEKSAIDIDDVRLAIRSKTAFSFTQPPPRDVTMRLAAERNSIPLPSVDQRSGISLPSSEGQLTAQNFRIIINPKQLPEKTPQSSPKRPRLSSSPAAPKKVKAPERTPRSNAMAISKSVQSPARMRIDSPVNNAKIGIQLSPGKIGTSVLPPVKQISPVRRSPSVGFGAPGGKPSPGKLLGANAGPKTPTQTADAIMRDIDPKRIESSGAIPVAGTQTGAAGAQSISLGSPNTTGILPMSKPPQ